MNRLWIAAVAAIAVAAAVIAANGAPMRSSEALLGKAQSEFAAKARTELIQRHMVHASAPSAATAATKPAAVTFETVAIPTAVSSETSPRRARALSAEGLESLRARSPELAAAMARYM